jgi:DNA polymerase I-like protein with 3'-5' exonuclease and polymerase domains
MKKIEDDFWGVRFAEYAEWKERWWNMYKKHGYIDMYTGFRCSGVMDKKQAINFPIQGSSFHCLLFFLIEIDKIIIKEKLDTRIINQIHDSVLFDTKPSELNYIIEISKEIINKQLPKTWEWLIVPMDFEAEFCEIDRSWAEKKKIKI